MKILSTLDLSLNEGCEEKMRYRAWLKETFHEGPVQVTLTLLECFIYDRIIWLIDYHGGVMNGKQLLIDHIEKGVEIFYIKLKEAQELEHRYALEEEEYKRFIEENPGKIDAFSPHRVRRGQSPLSD